MTTTAVATTDLYARVQHFYARQMQALDGMRFEEFAATFTEDGVFHHMPGAEPFRTRAGILRELVSHQRRYEAEATQRRHWFNHLALERRGEDSLRVTAYVLVLGTRPGGTPEMMRSCVMHDDLAVTGGELLVTSRRISYDHLPATP
jgi:actinorhodin biosynthesis protein ActVIA